MLFSWNSRLKEVSLHKEMEKDLLISLFCASVSDGNVPTDTAWGLLVVSLLVTVIVIMYNIYCKETARRQREADIAEMQLMRDTVTKLQQEGCEQTGRIGELNTVIEKIHDRHSEALDHGRELYESIKAGANVSQWHKSDFEDFIDYYWLVDAAFLCTVRATYAPLSPKHLFVLILQHEGYDDAELQRILCIADVSVRSIKSRIKQRRLS